MKSMVENRQGVLSALIKRLQLKWNQRVLEGFYAYNHC